MAKHGRSNATHRLLEPACGSGRLVLEFAGRGYDVTGYDLEPGMIRFARRRLEEAGLDGTLHEASMQGFDFAHPAAGYDFAFCLVSTFKYLLTEQDAVAHLERVAAVLAPGGVYALGLHISEYDVQEITHERWVGKRDGVAVTCNIHGWPPHARKRLERVRARLIASHDDGHIERYETEWQFRTYSLRQLRSLIAKVDAFEHVATYDFHYRIDEPIEFDGAHLDNILILKKRERATC